MFHGFVLDTWMNELGGAAMTLLFDERQVIVIPQKRYVADSFRRSSMRALAAMLQIIENLTMYFELAT
jgi:hypothetical protein